MTTLSGYTTGIPIAVPKKKRGLLPSLTVLFVISYGLMTMLIVEQGATIQSQSNLIKILLPDSRELWALKGKAIGDKQTNRAPAQSRAQGPSSRAQVPSVRTPSTQDHLTQTPSTPVPQHRSQKQAGKMAKPEAEVPPVPASDLLDQRRALRTI